MSLGEGGEQEREALLLSSYLLIVLYVMVSLVYPELVEVVEPYIFYDRLVCKDAQRHLQRVMEK